MDAKTDEMNIQQLIIWMISKFFKQNMITIMNTKLKEQLWDKRQTGMSKEKRVINTGKCFLNLEKENNWWVHTNLVNRP